MVICQLETLHEMARVCMQQIVDNLPSRSLAMGTERKDVAGKGSWHIPKFHAMLHSASSILLMGPWSNCEAQVIENNHVYMKRLAELTNQRVDQWELQILIHVARTEEAGNACNHETTALGDMKNNPLCAHEHASGSCATHITLSKSNLVSGIRSNIWEYMIAWKTCRHILVYPAQRTDARTNGGVYICMSDLVTPAQSSGARSEWIRYCRDMLHLPHYLGVYIQATYHRNIATVQAPTDDRASFLSAPEVYRELLSLVQVHDINDCRYGKGINPLIDIRYIAII